jgi:hypothetical protein
MLRKTKIKCYFILEEQNTIITMLNNSKQSKKISKKPKRCIKKRRLSFKNRSHIRHNVNKPVHNRPKHTPLERQIHKNNKSKHHNPKLIKLSSSTKYNIRFETSCNSCSLSSYDILRFKISETRNGNRQRYT